MAVGEIEAACMHHAHIAIRTEGASYSRGRHNNTSNEDRTTTALLPLSMTKRVRWPKYRVDAVEEFPGGEFPPAVTPRGLYTRLKSGFAFIDQDRGLLLLPPPTLECRLGDPFHLCM